MKILFQGGPADGQELEFGLPDEMLLPGETVRTYVNRKVLTYRYLGRRRILLDKGELVDQVFIVEQ